MDLRNVNIRVYRGRYRRLLVFLTVLFFAGWIACLWLVRDGLWWATAVHCQCVREASHTRL